MLNHPSNVEIARRLGIQAAAVSKWRNGHQLPTTENMVRISEAFGWSVESQVTSVRANRFHSDLEAKLRETFSDADSSRF